MANIRWKLITILIVLVVFAGVGVYPILAARRGIQSPSWLMDKQLKLGLDLKGGVHLVLRVQTDDALRLETDTETERLREELTKRNIPFTNLVAPDVTHFRVEGVPPAQEAAFRAAANEVQANFDRSPGASGTYIFTMKPNAQVTLRDEAVVQARETLERRVNELGVTEPSISQQGTDQLLVQLPGVTDVERAKAIMGSPGLLELKIVERQASTREELLVNGQVPAGMEIVPGAGGGPGNAATTLYYLVRKVAAVTGRDLRNARSSLDENNQPAVSFTLSNEGGRKFGNVTGENIGRQLAIILDGRVQSAPSINGRITTDGRITGSFTNEEVQNLSLILRSGALPAKLDYLEERTIGPSLGADSIRSGTTASLVGLLLIVVFMLIYYRFSGINAVDRAHLQPRHPARADGIHRRRDDAAGHRRLRADDGHRRGFERADLRAHQGGARSRARRPRVDERGLQPRLLDALRHAHRRADLGGVPLQLRHRPDPRLRGHAHARSGVQSVHVDFRIKNAL